jgi:hypothetical protein
MKERKGTDGVTFEIERIVRESTFLTVTVEGGCNESSFKFIWDGRIAESYPMQTWLVLVHEKNTSYCSDQSKFTLNLDLAKLINSTGDVNDFIFHVANGSVKQDFAIDQNGVSSGK